MRNRSWLFTQVAEAMTIRPVARSTAMTDQVALTVAGKIASSAHEAIARNERGMRIKLSCLGADRGGCISTCWAGAWRRKSGLPLYSVPASAVAAQPVGLEK